jgi:hypothetical protein
MTWAQNEEEGGFFSWLLGKQSAAVIPAATHPGWARAMSAVLHNFSSDIYTPLPGPHDYSFLIGEETQAGWPSQGHTANEMAKSGLELMSALLPPGEDSP